MKIIQYCQHVLGVGHFFRTLEIARAFAGHDVILVTGGRRVPTVKIPSHVREKVLPPLFMDEEFSRIMAPDRSSSVDQIKAERRRLLMDLLLTEAPDIFLVELYPFGRKAFAFELDPVLSVLRDRDGHKPLVVCSLRDILVEKTDRKKYENRVTEILNRYFHALVIHADPILVKLDETFSSIRNIRIPIRYTGFVAPRLNKNSRSQMRAELGMGPDDRLIVASAGGGQVGGPLLKAVVDALGELAEHMPVHLRCFAGPYLPQPDFAALNTYSHPRIRVSRFTDRFSDYLSAADLSVSMAGYNTCMNVLAAGVPALVLPFAQNREQLMRAKKLADIGVMGILKQEDLSPGRLTMRIKHVLESGRHAKPSVDLDGAAHTADWLLTFHPQQISEAL